MLQIKDASTSKPVDLHTKTLGVLLRECRTQDHQPLAEFARNNGIDRSVIEAVEVDNHALSIDELAEVVDVYGGPTIDQQMSTSALSIDIEHMAVALAHSAPRTDSAPAADRILRRYLLLLQADRGVAIGTEFPVREIDLSLMRNAMVLRPEAVTSQLAEIPSVEDHAAPITEHFLMRHRSLLLAGLLCGAVGLAVIANDSPTTIDQPVAEVVTTIVTETEAPVVNEPVATVEVVTDIGTAVSISRTPEEAGAVAEVTVEIGEAVVLER